MPPRKKKAAPRAPVKKAAARPAAKPQAKKPAPRKRAAAKSTPKTPSAGLKKPAAKTDAPRLLSGGNPQIPKGEGNAPVQAYIAAIPDAWKRDLCRRLDALIVREVPHVRKAVKWNSPFYGVEGQGYFLSYHVFTKYVKVTFFDGTSLRPVPPGGTQPEARWIDTYEGAFDEAQMREWVRQAAGLPGWDT